MIKKVKQMATKCDRCGLEDDSIEFDEGKGVPLCVTCKTEFSKVKGHYSHKGSECVHERHKHKKLVKV
jgi:hypothetical protein